MTLAKWRTLHDRIAYENQWVQVRVQAVELTDGERYSYTVVDRPAQGVATFLFDEDGRLLIEQEYRHAIGEVVWQLPGGLIDEGETPLESAQRELREETGYEAADWQPLGGFYDNPALGNAHSTLFVARHPRRAARARDAAEWVTTQWVTMDWLREAIRAGQIVDRVILSGVAMLWATQNGNAEQLTQNAEQLTQSS